MLVGKVAPKCELLHISTYFECFDDVLVLEVPDEHVRVSTPTDKVAIGVHETATREATSVLKGWGRWAEQIMPLESIAYHILVLHTPSDGC